MKKGCLKHRYYPGGLRREKRASGRTLMSYTYDLDGRKISQRNLTGKSTGYAYNRNGMLSQVMENGRCFAAYEYYADGNIKSLRIGTDLITDYAYDLNKNLTTIRTTLGGGSIVCDNKYTYDGNGNRLSKADRQGLTKYAYDANNQLVQVQYPQGGLENYSYDAAGNRLGRSADGIQENYRYDNCNRLIQLTRMTTQQETVTYSYDRQGNMLSDGRNRYAYDDFGRLASTVTAEGDIQKNCYDAEGLRAEMEENGRLVQFLYNEDREVVAEKDYSGNLIRYIRGLGLISSDSENAKTYYHYVCDEQGSVSHIIRGEDKESGVSEQGREQDRILNQYEYDAFGNTISCKEQVENRFRYMGEQYDPLTGQYYLRARYYNPVIARFTQEDTYYGDGLNLYTYCRNNPILNHDPTGHGTKENSPYSRKEQQYIDAGADPDTAKLATQCYPDAKSKQDLYNKYKSQGYNATDAKKLANYEIVHGEERAKNYAANNVKKSGPDYTATSPRENPNTDWRTQNRLNAQKKAGAGKSGRKADFYVTPSGDVVPATGYRYMDSGRANDAIISGEQYTTYIGFKKYDSASQVKDAFQIADSWSDCKVRGEFDTLQVIDDLYVPTTKGNTTAIPEPITFSYPEYGKGGEHQLRVDKVIKFTNVDFIGD